MLFHFRRTRQPTQPAKFARQKTLAFHGSSLNLSGLAPTAHTLIHAPCAAGFGLSGSPTVRTYWTIPSTTLGTGDFTVAIGVELTNTDTNTYSYAVGSNITYFALATRHSGISNNCGLLLPGSVWINTGINCSAQGTYNIVIARRNGIAYWNINGQSGSAANTTNISSAITALALSGYDLAGGSGGGSSAYPNRYYAVAFEPAAWSDEEMQAWAANPHQLWGSIPAPIVVEAPAAGGTGALNVSQGADTASALGSLPIVGGVNASQSGDAVTAAGQGAGPISGALAVQQDGDSLTGGGTLPITGALGASQAGDGIAASAQLVLSAALSASQSGDALAAQGTNAATGFVSQAQADNALTGTGALSLSGYLAATQADDTLSASAVLAIVGSMSTAQAADVLIATGARDLFGTLSAVQASQTLAASGASVVGLTDSQKIDLILKILSDRQTLDPATGIYTLYDTDGTTILYTATAWEDTGGTIPYRGQQLQRLDPLT